MMLFKAISTLAIIFAVVSADAVSDIGNYLVTFSNRFEEYWVWIPERSYYPINNISAESIQMQVLRVLDNYLLNNLPKIIGSSPPSEG
ncbi:hypothetical protein CAEBREN_12349 [Caenorhabditis brenneri]|uniref:Uncharacterized protein n=1 Tax=Caenorhabditis brenneri TaxID=135651 RepID=G0N2F9_CAEBE|nr:hypothetical protein CAEBREN_12349 [Caenorhabditis brenneri]